MDSGNELERELFRQTGEMPVIDAHEHVPSEAERLELEPDAVSLFENYNMHDLRLAGMSREQSLTMVDRSRPLDERWEIFSRYFPYIRNTSYTRNTLLGIRELYGYDDVTADNYVDLTEAMQVANRPGIYRRVFKDQCNIVAALNQEFEPIWKLPEPGNFRIPQLWEGQINIGFGTHALGRIQAELGRSVSTLDSYVDAVEELLAHYRAKGVVGIKLSKHIVESRPLADEVRPLFDRLVRYGEESTTIPTRVSAKECWSRYFKEGPSPVYREGQFDDDLLTSVEQTALRDYGAHAIFEAAGRVGMVIVQHCGNKGLWGDYRTANPANMVPVFMQHPKVRFELYHGGIPWMRETGIIGKGFPNVWLNLCWAHAQSRQMARNGLDEWLDMVPANKIIGFGGDTFLWIEWTIGDLIQARENIAAVLAKRVKERIFTEEYALDLARMLLFDNPRDLYDLDVKPTDEPAYV